MTLGPLSECHKGTRNARGDWGRRNMGELAPVGHGKGAIRHPRERSRRQVGGRACTPAAAGWLVEHPSSDPDVVRDNRGLRSLTPTTNSTRVSEGMGQEGGAACLRCHSEVGKLSLEASRAGAAGRITSTQAVSSPQRRDGIRHLWLVADMGGRDAKLPFAKSEARAHYFNVLSIAWTHCGGFFNPP